MEADPQGGGACPREVTLRGAPTPTERPHMPAELCLGEAGAAAVRTRVREEETPVTQQGYRA